jgi:hypothetical protein
MINSKKPWQMTRQQWLEAGSPDLEIKWVFGKRSTTPPPWEDTLGAEKQAIKDFLSLFEDVMKSLKEGGMTYRTLPERQENFGKSRWWHQHLSHLYKPVEGMEDAREAIIVGRKLGFPDVDILYYVVRNYIIRKEVV